MYNISVRSLYSTMNDGAMDDEARAIKSRLPAGYAGCQVVKGCLETEGHYVQWTRPIVFVCSVVCPLHLSFAVICPLPLPFKLNHPDTT